MIAYIKDVDGIATAHIEPKQRNSGNAGSYNDQRRKSGFFHLAYLRGRVRWETPETVKFEYFEKSGDAIAWAYQAFILGAD